MADETLSWDLRFDLAGKGLGEAAAGLGKLDVLLKIASRGVETIEKNWDRAGRAARRSTDMMEGAAKGVGTAVGVMVAAIGLGLHKLDQFGDKAVEAFAERQSSLRAYTALLGSASQAPEEFGKAQQLSMMMPFLSSQIEAAQKQLFVSGVRNEGGKAGGTADRSLLTIADYASLSADKNQALGSGTHAFSEIAGKGHLAERQLQQLVLDLGVSAPILRQELAKIMHIKEGDVEDAISKKKVDFSTFQAAFEQTRLRQLGGKALGDVATGGAGGLGVALINQQEQVKNLLKTFDASLLPGVQHYTKALQEQNAQFTLSTDTGRQMVQVLQDFSNTSTNLKADWTELVNGFYETFAETYSAAMAELGGGDSRAAAEQMRDLGRSIGQLGSIVAKVLHMIEPLIEYTAAILNHENLRSAAGKAEDARQREEADYRKGKTQVHLLKSGGITWVDEKTKKMYQAMGELAPDEPGQKAPASPAKVRPHATSIAATGGGGLGSLPSFHGDLSGLSGGLLLPHIFLPGMTASPLVGLQGYMASAQRDLAAGVEARKPVPAILKIEDVNIDISGATSPDDVARAVADYLRSLGRFARTPSPAVD